MKTIAIYPGSFNPFHVGHLNIVQKAERIFGYGNVIVAMGMNPDKVKANDEDYLKFNGLVRNILYWSIKCLVV